MVEFFSADIEFKVWKKRKRKNIINLSVKGRTLYREHYKVQEINAFWVHLNTWDLQYLGKDRLENYHTGIFGAGPKSNQCLDYTGLVFRWFKTSQLAEWSNFQDMI